MSEQKDVSLKEFLDFMTRKGLNITSQRRAIAAAFFDLSGHHSLDEFYQHIFSVDPGIGQTTVYRTLKLLCDAGLATEIHFSDGIARYEVAKSNSHHDHIVCLYCGNVLEIFDQRIEKLQQEIAQSHDFTLSGHVHYLYGMCAECRAGGAGGKR
ncbi:MAG: transcriptional repressor [Desulfovibrio sp.]|nr:transcriptional repressor [Desulfovibrio sp.]